MIEQEVDFVNGMDYLNGFDSLTLEHHGPAVKGSEPRELPGSGGQRTTCIIQLVNRQSDLATLMELSASASLKYALFGGGGAKYNFFNSTKINTYSLDLLIYVKVSNSQKTVELSKLSLNDDAKKLYKKNPDLFIKTYGDKFIYGLMTGGELFVKLSLQSESSELVNRVTFSLKASGGLGAWQGSASIDALREISETISSLQMLSQVERHGTQDNLPPVNDQSAIINYALQFPTKVKDQHSVPYRALLMQYDHIFPSEMDNITRQNQTDVMRSLGETRNVLISNLNDYSYAITHIDEFEDLDRKTVQDSYDKTKSAKESVEALAKSCFQDSTQCKLPDSNIMSAKKLCLPPRKDDTAMNKMMPIGSIVAFASSEDRVPENWKICNGDSLSKHKYPALWEKIGTTWGGDGNPDFKIPDLIGLFLRGFDPKGKRDPEGASRKLGGPIQDDKTRRPRTPFITDDPGDHYHGDPTWNGQSGKYEAGGPGSYGYDYGDQSAPTTSNGHHSHTIVNGGDVETRPINAAVNWIIKVC